MRVLGIDYGEKRIGIAVSDETGMVARPLTTILHTRLDRDCAVIRRLVEELGVERIVVGYPITLGGKESIQCSYVARFIEVLTSKIGVPVVRWDESMSTKRAEEILIESDMGRKRRKKIVDRLAAAIILQEYLERTADTQS